MLSKVHWHFVSFGAVATFIAIVCVEFCVGILLWVFFVVSWFRIPGLDRSVTCTVYFGAGYYMLAVYFGVPAKTTGRFPQDAAAPKLFHEDNTFFPSPLVFRSFCCALSSLLLLGALVFRVANKSTAVRRTFSLQLRRLWRVQIYWMHRTLHTNKFLYKYVHALHHKYNSAETLSPWASIAFNPLDGVLQVCVMVLQCMAEYWPHFVTSCT